MRALAILLVCACSATGGTISGLYGTAQEWSWEVMPFGDYTNCVMWLPFEYEWDASTNYLDASASTNDGTQATANARPTWVAASGATSAHYDFDGTDDYITIPDDDTLSFGDGASDSPFSVSAWVRPDDVDSFAVLGKGALASPDTGEYHMYLATGASLGKPVFVLEDADLNNTIYTVGGAVPVSEWTHICATYDGGGLNSGILIYTNGVESATTPGSAGSYTAMHNTSDPIDVGSRTIFSAAFADGAIDDIRIHAKELTAAEVLAIYDATSGAHP